MASYLNIFSYSFIQDIKKVYTYVFKEDFFEEISKGKLLSRNRDIFVIQNTFLEITDESRVSIDSINI